MLAIGNLLSRANLSIREYTSLHELEFKVFSQFGDDGIIQWLVDTLDLEQKTFIEFGVEDYTESNTRFLLMSKNWSGLVIDGDDANVRKIRHSAASWRHELYAVSAFIDCDNVNDLLSDQPFGREIGLLHIDVDGNDYWLWKAIQAVSPAIAIVEFNSILGSERAITVPYRADFRRGSAHHTNLYYGASLPALYELAIQKGFSFIGCNSAGNNAYFIRNDCLTDAIKVLSLSEGYIESKFRESRAVSGALTYLSGRSRVAAIRGLPVWNTRTNSLEEL